MLFVRAYFMQSHSAYTYTYMSLEAPDGGSFHPKLPTARVICRHVCLFPFGFTFSSFLFFFFGGEERTYDAVRKLYRARFEMTG